MSSIIVDDCRAIADRLPSFAALDGATVVVTGATGMVGRYLVGALIEIADRLDNGLQVIAMARNADKAALVFADRESSPYLEIVIGDVAERLATGGRRITHIIHAASPATPTQFRDDPVGVIRANVLGSFELLEVAREQGAYFAFISTMEIYGDVPRPDGAADVMLREDQMGGLDSTDQRSAYPESKRLAENLCVAYAAQYGVRSDILRLTHTYGPGMDLADSRVQADFVRKALAGEQIILKSDGTMSRTYTYIADAVCAVLWVLLSKQSEGTGVYNVADESSRTTIKGLAATVLKAGGRDQGDLRIDIDQQPGLLWSRTVGGTYVDCSRLRGLGWTARYPLTTGFDRTVRHHREDLAASGVRR